MSPSAAVTNRFNFEGDRKSVKAWFERGAKMHSIQSAAQKVLQGKGLQGMKTFLQKQPLPQSREMQPCTSSPAEVLIDQEILALKHSQSISKSI